MANQGKLVPLHKRLRRQWTRIVIRRHDETVRAGAHERDQIALLHFRQRPILRKKIAAFANGTDDIDRFARGVLRFADRHDLVITLVKRGPDQVVHSGIDDHEFLVLGLFDVADARQEDTGIADEQTARLDQHAQSELAQRRQDGGGIIVDRKRQGCRRLDAILFAPPIAASAGKRRFVNDPDPAADAEKLERDIVLSTRRISGVTFAIASANGAASVICEPMCICTPRIAMFGIRAACS